MYVGEQSHSSKKPDKKKANLKIGIKIIELFVSSVDGITCALQIC